jgi:hypothetical protein
MVTLGEAAGENLLFTANAIAETAAMAGFARVCANAPPARNEMGVPDTQNVINREGATFAYDPTPATTSSEHRHEASGDTVPPDTADMVHAGVIFRTF